MSRLSILRIGSDLVTKATKIRDSTRLNNPSVSEFTILCVCFIRNAEDVQLISGKLGAVHCDQTLLHVFISSVDT